MAADGACAAAAASEVRNPCRETDCCMMPPLMHGPKRRRGRRGTMGARVSKIRAESKLIFSREPEKLREGERMRLKDI